MALKVVDEHESALYTATLKDVDGSTIGSLDTLTLTLYAVRVSGQTRINSRDAQNVLNANNVTFAAGVVTWNLQPEDNIVVNAADMSTTQLEHHRALFQYSWDSGTKLGKHEVDIYVKKVDQVSALST